MTLIWCVSFLLVIYLSLVLYNYLIHAPSEVGLVDQKLSACPDSPNCVCSQDASPSHAIEPFPFSGSEEKAIKRLSDILVQQRGCRIVRQEANYLHAEFRSLCFRFVDDVEFVIDPEENQIHVRSASRVGHSDLGVNRRRIESLRELYLNNN